MPHVVFPLFVSPFYHYETGIEGEGEDERVEGRYLQVSGEGWLVVILP
jgi:hypothetical protein